MKNAGFENIYNPISPLRDFFADAITWAADFAGKHGIPLVY